MSIPKEPRALMINLMYLVLTAMLALNVSAKIMNAFILVNQGLDKSNTQIAENNQNLPKSIREGVKKDPANLKKYEDAIDPIQKLISSFTASVDNIKDDMIGQASPDKVISEDDWVDDHGMRKPAGYKDKDVTTRFLVGEPTDDTDGAADKLYTLIGKTREDLIKLIPAESDKEGKEEIQKLINNLPLAQDETWKAEGSEAKTWAEYNFKQMPVIATLPIFNKIKNDALASQSQILGHLAQKAGGKNIVFDNFEVVSAPKKSYIIKGEQFESDIFLAASSSNVKGLSVKVNSQSLPVKDGVAKFTESANSTGIKKYKASITMTNPVTGQVTNVEKQFEYEVGERSVNVAAEKMNVFYIGVENPVSVTAAGVSTNEIKVNASGGGLRLDKKGNGKYVATVSTPGESNITVSGGGLEPTKFMFRVKRIPDPVPMLGRGPNASGGSMGSGEMRAQEGIYADLQNFDFEARCEIVGYELTKVAPRQDPVSVQNSGARYSSQASNLTNSAKPGDRFFFDNIKAKCPGDVASRKLPSISFTIR